jgi:hypothetical protein
MKGIRRLLDAVGKLKELHAQQGKLRLKDIIHTSFDIELLATPRRESWRYGYMQ